ncbi:MAG: ribonuclease P protein component 4 [Nitrososphaerota archaeon]|nr:ribonuclease P protein component 4 [Nitrososphaerota archaeon]
MKNPKQQSTKQIAQHRIDTLFKQAEALSKTNPKLTAAYIKTAQKIAMSARTPLQTRYKRRICKHCNALLTPGYTSRTRIQQKREPHIITTCLNCGHNLRIMLRKKERKKRE